MGPDVPRSWQVLGAVAAGEMARKPGLVRFALERAWYAAGSARTQVRRCLARLQMALEPRRQPRRSAGA